MNTQKVKPLFCTGFGQICGGKTLQNNGLVFVKKSYKNPITNHKKPYKKLITHLVNPMSKPIKT